MAFDRVVGDRGVSDDGQISEAFGVAEFDGDDVLQEFGDGLCARDVAGDGEEFGVLGEELAPAVRRSVRSRQDFFGGRVRLAHDCLLFVSALWPMSRRNCMPSKDIVASSA